MGNALVSVFRWLTAKIYWATPTFIGHQAATVIATAASAIIIGGTYLAGMSLLGRKQGIPQIGLARQGISVLTNSPSNNAPIPVIYGARRVGGTRIFVGTSHKFGRGQDGPGGKDRATIDKKNGYLNMVIALCEGEIGSVEAVYLNNVQAWPVPDDRFQGKTYINVHLGSSDQEVDSVLQEESRKSGSAFTWSNNYRLRGVAYVYVRLEADQDVFASGVPTINADILGKQVADTRQLVNGEAGTAIVRYSNNPALCIRDYLTDTIYGRGISSSDIDDTSFESAASYCDEEITLNIEDGTTVTQKKYTMNGVVTIGETSLVILGKMLTSCRGMIIFSSGKYKIIIDKAETATLTFNESVVLPNYIISLGSKDEIANQISVQFFNPDREWQADFSYVSKPSFKEDDNDLLLERSIELPFTADATMSKYIGEQNLKQSRQSIMIDFKTTQEGLLAEVGDIVYLDLEAPGWSDLNSGSGKKFRVMQVGIESSDEVSILAREYDETVYTPGTIPKRDTAPNTTLPSLSDVSLPTSISVSEELIFNTPKINNRTTISWTASTDGMTTTYDIAFKRGNTSTFLQEGTTSTAQYIFDGLEPGLYTFLVRAVNLAGFKSRWATGIAQIKGIGILPAINPPAITGVTESLVSTFEGSGVKAKATLTWAAVANADWEAIGVNIEFYEVEYKLASTSNNFEGIGSSTGTFFEFFDITPDEYNFRIRAVNDGGVKSGYTETTAIISGLTTAPVDITNFYSRADSSEAHLSWTPTTDLDVKVGGSFEIRHSVATSGATWEQAIRIGDKISGISTGITMPLLVGTYLIKAVDSTGHKSANATSIINTVSPSLFVKKTVSTITDTAFSGTKTNMIVDSTTGYLKFEGDVLWDSITDDIDDWPLIDSIGGLDLSGSYEFSDKIDLTLAASALLSGSITFTAVNTTDFWDERTGNIDDWLAIDANTFDDLLAQLYVASTNDDPASGGATWSDWSNFTIGNYYGRGFKFKLEASSSDTTHQINVSQLLTKAEAFYRLEGNSQTTDAAGSAITFDSAFIATPVVGISAQNLTTGDYYTIASLSSTGFTVRFFNSSDTGIARTVDWLARGY